MDTGFLLLENDKTLPTYPHTHISCFITRGTYPHFLMSSPPLAYLLLFKHLSPREMTQGHFILTLGEKENGKQHQALSERESHHRREVG